MRKTRKIFSDFFVKPWHTGVHKEKKLNQLFETCMVPACPGWDIRNEDAPLYRVPPSSNRITDGALSNTKYKSWKNWGTCMNKTYEIIMGVVGYTN